MSNQCEIDAKATPEQGRGEADSRVGSGGGLCQINPSQSLSLLTVMPSESTSCSSGRLCLFATSTFSVRFTAKPAFCSGMSRQ